MLPESPEAKDEKKTALDECYGTASCLIPSHLINYASLILLNKLSIFFHPIIVWPCGQYYKVQGWAHV